MTIKNKKIKVSSTGYEGFQKSLIEVSKKFINLDDAEKNKKLGEVMRNLILGLSGQKRLDKKLTKDEVIFSKLFRGFSEIADSYESLLDCEIYVKQYPNYQSFKKRNITRTKYLRYHIEKYFEEMYILRERIRAYSNVIKKHFKGNKGRVTIIGGVQKVMEKALENIVRIRGTHIHRYRYIDEDFDRLNALELFCKGKDLNTWLINYTRKMV